MTVTRISTYEANPVTGILSLVIRDRDGNILTKDTGKNMIMTATKSALASLVAGEGQNKVVSYIGLGNSPLTPNPGDTKLGGVLTTSMAIGETRVNSILVGYIKSISSYSFPSEGRVTFSWTIDFSEANGLEINEFALVCSDYTLFSRKTRGTIVKNSDLAIDGNWTIIF